MTTNTTKVAEAATVATSLLGRVCTQIDRLGDRLDEDTLYLWCRAVGHRNIKSPDAKGALLALMREAWGEPRAYVENDVDGYGWSWIVLTEEGGQEFTEIEALVSGLEASP